MKSRKLTAGLALVLAASSLVGCSSGTTDETTTDETATDSVEHTEGWTNPYPDVQFRGSNYANIKDDELNKLFNEGVETTDEAKSIATFRKAFAKSTELVPYLAIYGNNMVNIYSKDITDVETGPVCNWSKALANAKSANADNSIISGITSGFNGVFSPLYATTANDQYVVNMIYQPLYDYNADSELYPVLAADEAPTLAEDGMSVTYHLKEGQKFSDGSDLDANDVKFTFTLLADPDYAGSVNDGIFNDYIEGWKEYQTGDAEEVTGIVVEDPYTVTFKFSDENCDAVNNISTVGILSDTQYEYTKGDLGDYKNKNDEPMGSGPYVLNSFDKSVGVSLVKNPEYTGDGAYSIEKVIIKIIASGTELSALQSGDINYLAENFEPGVVGPAVKDENLAYDTYFRSSEGYFTFNCVDGATQDVAVRQALAYATDRQGFVDAYYAYPEGDEADIALGYVPVAFWSPVAEGTGVLTTGEETEDGVVNYTFDMDKANKILDDAGWVKGDDGIREKDGQKLEIKFLASADNPVIEMILPMIKKTWGDLGADVKESVVDWTTLSDTVSSDNLDRSGWNVFFMALSFTGLSNNLRDVFGFIENTSSEEEKVEENDEADVEAEDKDAEGDSND